MIKNFIKFTFIIIPKN